MWEDATDTEMVAARHRIRPNRPAIEIWQTVLERELRLGRKQFRDLAKIGTPIDAARGRVIANAGDLDRELIIVVSGVVAIHDAARNQLAVVERGGSLGRARTQEPSIGAVTATCLERSQLLVLSRAECATLEGEQSDVLGLLAERQHRRLPSSTGLEAPSAKRALRGQPARA